jgi:hypothetical protein
LSSGWRNSLGGFAERKHLRTSSMRLGVGAPNPLRLLVLPVRASRHATCFRRGSLSLENRWRTHVLSSPGYFDLSGAGPECPRRSSDRGLRRHLVFACRHLVAVPDAHSDSDPYAYTHSNTHVYAHPDPCTHTNTDSPDTHSHPHTEPHPPHKAPPPPQPPTPTPPPPPPPPQPRERAGRPAGPLAQQRQPSSHRDPERRRL